MFLQRPSPNHTETLLDYHSAVFDEWLRSQLRPWASIPVLPYFLAAVTLVDQLNVDPKGFNWRTFSVILSSEMAAGGLIPVAQALTEPIVLFDGTESQVAYPKIVSNFLTDPVRARRFYVGSVTYVNLAKQIMNILRDQ
jgi:hypothetical protein